MPTTEEYRLGMVARQIERRGITDPRVLDAMRTVPRHRFVENASIEDAYADHPISIGEGQTISQPFMVALMTQLLAPQPEDRILEIGAGSGYQTAVLAHLCRHVYAVERLPSLSERARGVLGELGIENVTWYTADGTAGLPAEAPFDGILVAAGAPRVPPPLVEQLAEGGRLVIPVGERGMQELLRVTRRGDDLEEHRDTACRFVDLVGKHGW